MEFLIVKDTMYLFSECYEILEKMYKISCSSLENSIHDIKGD